MTKRIPTHRVKKDAMWEGKESPFCELEVTVLDTFGSHNMAGFDCDVLVHASAEELAERHTSCAAHPKTGKILERYTAEEIVEIYGTIYLSSVHIGSVYRDLPKDSLVVEFDSEQLEPIFENVAGELVRFISLAQVMITSLDNEARTSLIDEIGHILIGGNVRGKINTIASRLKNLGIW